MGSGSRLIAWESRLGQTLPSHVGKVEWQAVSRNSMVINLMGGDMHWTSAFRGYGYGEVLKTDSVLGRLPVWLAPTAKIPTTTTISRSRQRELVQARSVLGSHDIKVGGEYMCRPIGPSADLAGRDVAGVTGVHLTVTFPQYDSGNYQLQFLNGVANRLIAFNYPASRSTSSTTRASTSRIRGGSGRLTLNLGGRFAHDNGFAPEQCRVAAERPGRRRVSRPVLPEGPDEDLPLLVPRLHAAYDLTGDGKTVVKGGWGASCSCATPTRRSIANWNQRECHAPTSGTT